MLWGIGDQLAKQIGNEKEWKGAVEAAKLMGGEYMTFVNLFEQFFPVVTLVNKQEVLHAHEMAYETLEED